MKNQKLRPRKQIGVMATGIFVGAILVLSLGAQTIKYRTSSVKPVFPKSSVDRVASSKSFRNPASNSPLNVNPPPPTTQPSQLADAQIETYRQQILYLESCYKMNCGYSQSYPKAYSNEAGQKLKIKLDELRTFALASRLKNPQISAIARAELQNADGFVKEAALSILQTQDPLPENRDAILQNVIADFDSTLIAQGIEQLQRYDLSGSPKIHEALIDAMAQGAPFVASTIAQNITPFITAGTYDQYLSALQRLSPGTKTYLALRQALSEFQLHQTGG